MIPILDVRGLTQVAGGCKILRDVTIELRPRERLGVIGPSGSGKTTLLRLIAGLDAPAEGEITIAGRQASAAGRVILPPERRGVAMVFQGLALFPHLRALEQIAFAARDHGGAPAAKSLLERVGLGHRANARPDELSGGERQRIALARALAQQPALLLMDEPFASLDDAHRAAMRQLLRSLLDEADTALVLVTHGRDDALSLAQRALVLSEGTPVVFDDLEAILTAPRHVAAVESLGLAQLLDAHVSVGPAGVPIADTALGDLPVRPETPLGQTRLLLRPGQLRIADEGDVAAEVISLELRVPDASGAAHFAVCRVGEQLLHAQLDGARVVAGQTVRLVVRGRLDVIAGK